VRLYAAARATWTSLPSMQMLGLSSISPGRAGTNKYLLRKEIFLSALFRTLFASIDFSIDLA